MEFASYFSSIAGNAELGLMHALSPINLFYCAIGVTVGTLLGALPGLGTFIAMALLFPITFHLTPTTGMIMLAGIYYGTSYGGSICSILLNVPGEAKSALACIDGYPMAKQGRAGVALSMTGVSSFIGGSIGILLMMLFAPLISQWALNFGPAAFFALMVLGLVISSSAASDSPMAGYAMVALGIAFGLVGTDLESNVQRYTFGILNIWDGFGITALAVGLFGVTEMIATMRTQQQGTIDRSTVTLRALIPSWDDFRRTVFSGLRGGAIGATTGSIPGTGGLIAAFVSYAVEKKVAKDPSRFGKGAIEGVTGPESANNAADQAAFIPTLTLGIPGTPALALLLGVLLIHGLAPGPNLINEKPDMFWGLVMSFWIGNVMLLILNIPLVGLWVRILLIPPHIFFPAVLFFIALGAYSVNTSAFDVGEVIFFGLIGYGLRLIDMPLAPLVLGFILGPPLEVQFRRTLTFGGGDFSAFVTQPLAASLLALSTVIVVFSVWSAMRSHGKLIPTEETPT